ncbi:uncharacterized [Tachysurus ichikawai]
MLLVKGDDSGPPGRSELDFHHLITVSVFPLVMKAEALAKTSRIMRMENHFISRCLAEFGRRMVVKPQTRGSPSCTPELCSGRIEEQSSFLTRRYKSIGR